MKPPFRMTVDAPVELEKEVYLGGAALKRLCPRCEKLCELEVVYHATKNEPKDAILWCSRCDDNEEDDTFFCVGTVTLVPKLEVIYQLNDKTDWRGH